MRERDLFKKNYPEIKMSEEAKQKLFDLPNVEKSQDLSVELAVKIIPHAVIFPQILHCQVLHQKWLFPRLHFVP